MNEDFTFGIEEEYFLCDAETMEAVTKTPERFFEELSERSNGAAGHECLQAQLEICTAPQADTHKAFGELREIRQMAVEVGKKYGFAILACGTHPTARWAEVSRTNSERYHKVMNALQMIGERNMLCGMHVHVELPDPAQRIDVMSRLIPYLPLFIALSTSSPFWQSRVVGLKSYRLAAYDELPRSGIPGPFKTQAEYDAYVNALVGSGIIEDSSYIWWMLRPSLKYPTIELRAPDCCTRIEDAIAIASLFRAIVRHLVMNPDHNRNVNALTHSLTIENKWQAQRFGVDAKFATERGALSVAAMLESILASISADAKALDCVNEVNHCRAIISKGTSADNQLRLFHESGNLDPVSKFKKVSAWIAEATMPA